MTTLIPGNSQVLTIRDTLTALGLEATIELIDALRATPSGYDGYGAPIYSWQEAPTTRAAQQTQTRAH